MQPRRKKPKKPKRLRKAERKQQKAEELSNTLLAPSSLKKGFKNNKDYEETKDSLMHSNIVNRDPNEVLSKSTVETLPIPEDQVAKNTISEPRARSKSKSRRRKTLTMLGLGSKPKIKIALENPTIQNSKPKKLRKPKKPKRERANQAKTVKNSKIATSATPEQKFFIPMYEKKSLVDVNASKNTEKHKPENKAFFIPSYSKEKKKDFTVSKDEKKVTADSEKLTDAIAERENVLQQKKSQSSKKFFIPSYDKPGVADNNSPSILTKEKKSSKAANVAGIVETEKNTASKAQQGENRTFMKKQALRGSKSNESSTDKIDTPTVLKPSVGAPIKMQKDLPSSAALDLNKSSTLPKKVKKPKRARKTRNTLIKKTVNNIFKRASNKRKSQTESENISPEEESIKKKLQEKNKKQLDKADLQTNPIESITSETSKLHQNNKEKASPEISNKELVKTSATKLSGESEKLKNRDLSEPQEVAQSNVPKVETPESQKVEQVSVDEAPPMPPRVDSPRIPKKEPEFNDVPPMPPRIEALSTVKNENKDDAPPMPPRIESPRVPKKDTKYVEDEAPPMPPRVNSPRVPSKVRKIQVDKALQIDSPPVPSRNKKPKVINLQEETEAKKLDTVPVTTNENDVNVLQPSSSRKPNSGQGKDSKSSKEMKAEFQAKDKFRQSFWVRRGTKKPREKKVRESLALLRTGKLKPLVFKPTENGKKPSPVEELKAQYQKNDKFRASFWKRKTGSKTKKQQQRKIQGLGANLKQFAGILENTLNKKPGEKEEVNVGQLDVDQGLLTSEVKTGEDGKVDYSAFLKMVKFRLPEGAIRQKMMRDKLTDEQIEYFFSHVKNEPERFEAKELEETVTTTTSGQTTVKMLEKAGMTDYRKYITLAKNKMPEPVIVGAMTRDGLSSENQEFFLANMSNLDLIKPPEDRFPKLKLEDQRGEWDYSKYQKMVKIKVPEMVIKRDMANDGLSPENIDFFYANIDQLELLKSAEDETVSIIQSVKPSFLSDIEGLKNGNKLKKAPVQPKKSKTLQKKKSVEEGPGLLSELKKRMQTLKRGTATLDV